MDEVEQWCFYDTYVRPRSRDRPLYILVTSAIGERLHGRPFKINTLSFFDIFSHAFISH